MKEITIGKNIIRLRKEKGISQDVLASYLNVSKAAVSKWETAQSYPDITLLPKISTYFNISIDTLMGYEPQMSKKEIRILYENFAQRFASEPFHEVYKSTQAILKEYFSCYPLVLQIGVLYLNYSHVAKAEKKEAVLLEAKKQFVRIKNESKDVALIKQSQNLEATALLMLNKPNEIIQLLGEDIPPLVSCDIIQSLAYQMTGDVKKAKYVIQVSNYQYLLTLIQQLATYLTFCTDDKKQFIKVYKRVVHLSEIFNFEELHPTSLMQVYMAGAQGFMTFNDEEGALEVLETYTNLVLSDIYPLALHGDDFFDMIDTWFLYIDYPLPRDQKSVRLDIIQGVEMNPVFAPLQQNNRFQTLVAKLKKVI